MNQINAKTVGAIITIILLSGCTFQSGTTKDQVSGYDKGVLWYHAYLKNDHRTAYCFDDSALADKFSDAQKSGKEVVISYETYLIRGWFCTVSPSYETVIVTKVE